MQGKRALRRSLNRRRPLLHGSRSPASRQESPRTVNVPVLPQPEAFDPDMLYVECGRCGAPIVWEKGRTRRLLAAVGIDPLELDASCVLVSDSCPLCGGKGHYTIQIYRISAARSARHVFCAFRLAGHLPASRRYHAPASAIPLCCRKARLHIPGSPRPVKTLRTTLGGVVICLSTI